MGLANDFYDRAQQDFDRAQHDWETEPDYEDFDDPAEVVGVLGQLAELYDQMSRAKWDTKYAVPPESAARIAQALDTAIGMINYAYLK